MKIRKRDSFLLLASIIFLASFNRLQADEAVIEEGKPMEEMGIYERLDNGDWINVRINDNVIYAYFLNSDRTLKTVNAESILFDVDKVGTYGKNARFRAVLKATSSLEFSAPRKIYPPYDFFFSLIIRYSNDDVEPITRIKYLDASVKN